MWKAGGPGSFPEHVSSNEGGNVDPVDPGVIDSLWAASNQARQYQIPVSIKGGTYQDLVYSGYNQTSILQGLMQQRTLDTSCKVKVWCAHWDVVDNC